MKKKCESIGCINVRLSKMYLTMKLICVFIFLFSVNLSASVYSQNTKLTVSLEDVSIQKVFEEIRNNSEFTFIYNNDDLKDIDNISINVKDESIKDILNFCFRNSNLSFIVEDRVIIIKNSQKQQKRRLIHGHILDVNGSALPGVSVVIQGTNIGVSSDIDGHFEILIQDSKDKFLEISFIGMETQLVKITSKNAYKIVLKEDATKLDDVVVTGFQTISKERATGSFDLVDTEQLDKPAQDISSRLQGVVSGIQTKVDSDGKKEFEIRGKSSLNANANPLVVVDGFPIEGDFASINPNNVESVTILKDAAAASIWGARSANGVIVVTTKRASKGTPLKVSLSAFTKISDNFDLSYADPKASSKDQIEMEKRAYNKWGALMPSGNNSSDYYKQYTLGLLNLYRYDRGLITAEERDRVFSELSKIDYKDDVYKYLLQKPVYQQYNVSISGSSDRVDSFVSLLFDKDQTDYVGTKSKKYQFDSKFKFRATKWLDLSFGTMLQSIENKNNGVTLNDLRDLSPYERLINPDGSYSRVVKDYFMPIFDNMPLDQFPYSDWSYNPLREIRNRDITKKDFNTRIFAGVTLKIIEGLTFNSKIQYELFSTKNRSLYKEDSYYVRNIVNRYTDWDPATGKVLTHHLPKGDILEQSYSEVKSYNFRNQVNFNRVFAEDHELNVIAGSEHRSREFNRVSLPTTYGYNDETLSQGYFQNGIGGTRNNVLKDWLGWTTSISAKNGFSYSLDKFFSLFGNMAYTYKGKYSMSASVRTDASNLITDDPKYRYAPFWSVGLGWNVSKESFMKDIEYIDVLKLRATYGYNGNIDKSTSFKPLVSLSSQTNSYTNQNTTSIRSYGNPMLRWEKTGTTNFGVDFSFLKGKLFGKLDLYRKHGVDLMAEIEMSSVNGTSYQKFNNAEILNQGFEIELGTSLNILNKDIVWNGNVNYAYNKNKVLKLFIKNYSGFALTGGTYVEGKDASTIWAFEYAGINENQPSIKGPNGEYYVFGDYPPNSVDGRTYTKEMGVRNAPHILGFNNNFKVYDFNISFIVTGKFGHIFKVNGYNHGAVWANKFSPNKYVRDYLSGKSRIPLPLTDDEPKYYRWDRYANKLVENWHDASHIRFQELNITYNIPSKILSKVDVSAAKVYVQANNLGVIAANKFGMDPEFPEGTIKPVTSFIFGVKLDF